jgi:hypothetical protein
MIAVIFVIFLTSFFIGTVADLYVRPVAGYGAYGYAGDNGPATVARVYPNGRLWADSNGQVYIPDSGNYRIRRIDTTGIITTFGGTGSYGTAGGSGPILSMNFANPISIVGDTGGTVLYMSDTKYIWRYYFNSQIISVIVGSSTPGFSGDNGPFSNAQLDNPNGLWLTTSGFLYIADTNNRRIRKVDTTGTIITTIAGSSGPAGTSGDSGLATLATLNNPQNLFVDSNGNLFIADGGRIRFVNTNNNIISTFIGNTASSSYNGDGLPLLWTNLYAGDVKGDSLGNIYIADNSNCRIRKVDTQGRVTTLVGNGLCETSLLFSGLPTSVYYTTGLWLDSQGTFYFTEAGIIRKLYSSSNIPTLAPTVASPTSQWMFPVAGTTINGFGGDNGPATAARFNSLNGIWVDSTGSIFAADEQNYRIRKIDPNGIIRTFGGSGTSGTSSSSKPLSSATFFRPYSIVGDFATTVFHSRIRRRRWTSNLRPTQRSNRSVAYRIGCSLYC